LKTLSWIFHSERCGILGECGDFVAFVLLLELESMNSNQNPNEVDFCED